MFFFNLWLHFSFPPKRRQGVEGTQVLLLYNGIAALGAANTAINRVKLHPRCARLKCPHGSRQQTKLTGTRHTVEPIKSLLLQEAVLFNWFIFLKQGL